VAVPQLSGRGLGHTGGTLDKMESIPGWRAELSNAEIVAQLRAAELVRERVHAIDGTPVGAALHFLSRRRRDALGGVIHAADRVHDPDLVAHADAAVGAAEPVEGGCSRRRQLAQVGQAGVAGAEVVDRQQHAQLRQLAEGTQGGLRVLHRHRLGDLEAQQARLDVVLGTEGDASRTWSDPEGLHLACGSCAPDPVTHGPLVYNKSRQELISASARLAYPIRDGVPLMLPEEAQESIFSAQQAVPA